MKSSFLVNFLSLNISSFYNKLLNFFLFIFLIRLLSVQDYGTYNLVWAHIGLLAPFIDFGTTTYGLIHLPQEKKEHFIDVTSFRTVLAVIIYFLTIINAFVLKYSLGTIYYIVLLSVVILANMWSGTYLMLTSVKEQNYKASILSIIFNTVLIGSLIYTLFIFKGLNIVFIVISLFYGVYGLLNYLLVQREFGKFRLRINTTVWKHIVQKSYIFVLISFFAGLYFKLDLLLLQHFRSTAEVGIYSAGYKFFEALIFIASAYNFTGAPILAKIYTEHKKQFLNKILKDAGFLGIIGILAAISLYIVSPFVLPLVLKGGYGDSLRVLQVTLLALPCLFVTTIFLNGLYVIKKSNLVVYVFIFLTVFNFIANVLLIPYFSYMASAWITVASEIINMIIVMTLFFTSYKHD